MGGMSVTVLAYESHGSPSGEPQSGQFSSDSTTGGAFVSGFFLATPL